MSANIRARRRRLIVLADFLENEVLPILDGAKFNMDTWGTANHTVDNVAVLTVDSTSECGFEGCAMGWGIMCPALRRAGILDTLVNRNPHRLYGVEFSEERIAKFFGLHLDYYAPEKDEVAKAFLGGGRGRRGIVAVAKRLRRIAEREPPPKSALTE